MTELKFACPVNMTGYCRKIILRPAFRRQNFTVQTGTRPLEYREYRPWEITLYLTIMHVFHVIIRKS